MVSGGAGMVRVRGEKVGIVRVLSPENSEVTVAGKKLTSGSPLSVRERGEWAAGWVPPGGLG